MASEQAHISIASHNVETASFLNQNEKWHDWTATTTFYAALHVVDAVLAADGPAGHGQSHDERAAILKTTKRYEQIWRHYRPLFAASLVARYLQARSGGPTYGSFSDYLTPTQVRDMLMKHHLVSSYSLQRNSFLQTQRKLFLEPKILSAD